MVCAELCLIWIMSFRRYQLSKNTQQKQNPGIFIVVSGSSQAIRQTGKITDLMINRLEKLQNNLIDMRIQTRQDQQNVSRPMTLEDGRRESHMTSQHPHNMSNYKAYRSTEIHSSVIDITLFPISDQKGTLSLLHSSSS